MNNNRVAMVESPRIADSEWQRIEGEAQEAQAVDTSAADWSDLLESAPVASPADFRIDSDERADWLLRKLADATARAERAKTWAEREVEQAEAERARLLARFGGELEAFARQRITGGRRKSLPLPSGTIGFRSEPARLVVDDEEAAKEWAKKNAPQAVNVVTSERLLKTELAAATKVTGEVPDGTHWSDGGDRFFVK